MKKLAGMLLGVSAGWLFYSMVARAPRQEEIADIGNELP